MTDAAAPASAPQVRVCAELGCGRTSPPYPPFRAHGMCERSLGRLYRGRLGLPPNPALAELQAAYQRALTYRQPETDALDHFTAIVRLAYAAGLSTYDIADATGYRPGQKVGWSPMSIHRRLLPDQRRSRGQVGQGRTPPPEKVAEWAPQIRAATDAIDAARERRAEAWQTFLELLREVTAERRRRWSGLRVVGDALGVSHTQVQDWLRPAEEKPEPGRCEGRRTGPRGDGRRCRAPARRGKRTCWRHADQEPVR